MSAPPASPYAPLIVARARGLAIRRKHEDDFAQDYAWRQDPELARYDGADPPTLTFPEYAERMARELRFGDPARESFSIEDQAGEHIGNIMFYNGGYSREAAELGMVLAHPGYRGRGYGSALIVAFVRHLWAHYPFRRLYLHTLEWNGRARAAFARAGFEETARVIRGKDTFVRMETRREWWLLWDAEGRFDALS